MKKYNLYLWFIALVGLITSCSQDEAAGPQNDVSNRVRIGASIEQAVQTRAASVTIPDGYYLRYVLEVWSTSASSLIYKDEKTTEDATAAEFEFKLEDNGDYKVLLWADFVKKDASTSTVEFPNQYTHYNDKHYITTSLKAVTLAGDYTVNDESRDAFFACETIKKEEGALNESITLTRPFGQINIIEKDTELLKKVKSITLAYKVPDVFNVEDGATNGTKKVNSTVSTLPTATDVRKVNLFYDFIFTPATGQTTLGEIKMTFTSSDPAVALSEFAIPANMPVERNKRTNISGSILHASDAPSNDAKLSVTVSDAWTTPDEEEEIVAAPKVGDFYFANGTWSSNYSYEPSNPCIGIVFQTDPSRIGEAEKAALAAKGITTPHGLVMALSNAATSVAWGPVEAYDFSELTNCATKEQCNDDISGLHNYNTVIAYAELNGKLDAYPAFKAVKEFDVAVPAATTGWYLPSVGQWYDILANLGGLQGWGSATAAGDNCYWTEQTELVKRLNSYFALIGENYDAFLPRGSSGQKFWSSSEFSGVGARYWDVNSSGTVYCYWGGKHVSLDVRPVFAF